MIQEKELKKVKKEVSEAFGKKIFLLGRMDGKRIWLEAGSWDCGWYWGFGYLETYTNDAFPGHSRDIQSHSHVKGVIFQKPEYYDHDKGAFVMGSDYLHHWNEARGLTETTLTNSESWEFSDLMQSFYTLQDAAAIYYQGDSHLTSVPRCDLKNKEAYDRINRVEIPAIMARIYEILSPETTK